MLLMTYGRDGIRSSWAALKYGHEDLYEPAMNWFGLSPSEYWVPSDDSASSISSLINSFAMYLRCNLRRRNRKLRCATSPPQIWWCAGPKSYPDYLSGFLLSPRPFGVHQSAATRNKRSVDQFQATRRRPGERSHHSPQAKWNPNCGPVRPGVPQGKLKGIHQHGKLCWHRSRTDVQAEWRRFTLWTPIGREGWRQLATRWLSGHVTRAEVSTPEEDLPRTRLLSPGAVLVAQDDASIGQHWADLVDSRHCYTGFIRGRFANAFLSTRNRLVFRLTEFSRRRSRPSPPTEYPGLFGRN